MRRRLAITAAAIVSLVALAFVVPLFVLVGRVAEDRALAAAEREANSLVAVLATVDDPEVLESVIALAATDDDHEVAVFRADGTTLGTASVTPTADEVAVAREGRAFTTSTEGGKAVFVPVVVPGGEIDVIRVFVPTDELRRGVRSSRLLLGGLGVVLFAIGIAVADRLARAVVGPMGELADVARRLGRGEATARASESGPPEAADIARAVNQLAERIDELLAAEREGVVDLSHRLRTPLAVLRFEAESLSDQDAASRMTAAADDVARAVDRLINEARRPLREGVLARGDVAAVVRDRLAFWAPLLEDQGRTWHAVLPADEQVVAASTEDLEALVDALVANVVTHTPEGVPMELVVEPGANGHVRLIVTDEGPGIADPALLERGVSGAGSTGLGLDIVRRTALASGGDLTIGSGPAGGGASVVVDFSRPPQ